MNLTIRPPEVRIRLFSRCLDEWNYHKTVVDVRKSNRGRAREFVVVSHYAPPQSVSRINKEVTSDVQLEQLARLLIKKAVRRRSKIKTKRVYLSDK